MESITFWFIMFLMLFGFATSDINQDKTVCANQLGGLSSCLAYVVGGAKAPSTDCCGGLKQVLDKSRKCLCLLLQHKDDPSLGLKINTTLAATLPASCHTPINLTDCISLLHLAPNSSEAKTFEGYQKLTQTVTNTPTRSGNSTGSSSSAANLKSSDGGQRKKWVGFEMGFGVSLLIFGFVSGALFL